jgi:predicted ABC-type ATPase
MVAARAMGCQRTSTAPLATKINNLDPSRSRTDPRRRNSANKGGQLSVDEIIILGGPNGAGKTSAAQVVLPDRLELREFVNADEIARGLSPFNPEGVAVGAGRLMLERMQTLIRGRQSFAFETTCSGRSYIPLLRRCKADGWRVTLIYLWLPSPEMALERVARRVREGGHRIPDDVVVRRYWAGLANMRHLYLPLADTASIYDNSDRTLMLIAERTPESSFVIHDASRWAAIERARP